MERVREWQNKGVNTSVGDHICIQWVSHSLPRSKKVLIVPHASLVLTHRLIIETIGKDNSRNFQYLDLLDS